METLFRFATAGSVDDGKSTLVGRLLHDSKAILADQLESVMRTSTERRFGGAAGGIDFALLTDGLRAEREQGITIDVAYRYFATGQRSFILADCPGHVQYTRNMVTGATTADAIVMVIDVRHGLLEQTRRHLAVAHLLRVPHVIVAVNKIDLVDWSHDVFERVAAEVQVFSDELGLDAHVIPLSALLGDNVVERSVRMPWYSGPSLLELLESLPSTSEVDSVFRMPVQLVIRPQGNDERRDYRGFAGRISSGSVRVGDAVSVAPGNHSTVVTGIDVGGHAVQHAVAPQSVALSLADSVDAARGAIIAARGTLPEPVTEFTASLFWLDLRPLKRGDRVLVKWATTTLQAKVSEILGSQNLDTLNLEPADTLEVNDIGVARIRLSSALPLEPFDTDRAGGSFLIIHPVDGATLAAGIVTVSALPLRLSVSALSEQEAS